jgi:hypothetical protein
VVTLMVEVRFAHQIPADLAVVLRGYPTVLNVDRRYSTLTISVEDDPGVQRRIYDWIQQTCMVEGDVQAISVTRIGP